MQMAVSLGLLGDYNGFHGRHSGRENPSSHLFVKKLWGGLCNVDWPHLKTTCSTRMTNSLLISRLQVGHLAYVSQFVDAYLLQSGLQCSKTKWTTMACVCVLTFVIGVLVSFGSILSV